MLQIIYRVFLILFLVMFLFIISIYLFHRHFYPFWKHQPVAWGQVICKEGVISTSPSKTTLQIPSHLHFSIIHDMKSISEFYSQYLHLFDHPTIIIPTPLMQNSVVIGLIDKNTLIGIIRGSPFHLTICQEDFKTLYVDMLFIDPNYRKRRYAPFLISAIRDHFIDCPIGIFRSSSKRMPWPFFFHTIYWVSDTIDVLLFRTTNSTKDGRWILITKEDDLYDDHEHHGRNVCLTWKKNKEYTKEVLGRKDDYFILSRSSSKEWFFLHKLPFTMRQNEVYQLVSHSSGLSSSMVVHALYETLGGKKIRLIVENSDKFDDEKIKWTVFDHSYSYFYNFRHCSPFEKIDLKIPLV